MRPKPGLERWQNALLILSRVVIADEIQPLVDRLGRELKRGVMLDDHRWRLVAHSAHGDTIDRARTEAIVNRECLPAVREWLLQLGVEDGRDHARVPGNPALGMEPRTFVAVRFRGELLGHLWIIEGQALTAAELESAQRTASATAEALHRLRLTQQIQQGLEREGVRDLLDESPVVRHQAAVQLVEAELFRSAAGVCALVCATTNKALLDEIGRAHLDRALYDVRLKAGRRDMLYLIRPDHAVLLLAISSGHLEPGRVPELAAQLLHRVDAVGEGPRPMMGVTWGSVCEALDQAHVSYDHALRAAQIAQAFPTLGRLVAWDDLGVYRPLSKLAMSELDDATLHPAVLMLLGDPKGREHLELLEAYLDSGCDAVATAAQLGYHRGTVYYRLRRIQEVTGVSLDDGLERLAVHMSVKLVRLSGPGSVSPRRHPPGPGEQGLHQPDADDLANRSRAG